MKEAARQRRLKELEEKRHSWAGGEEVGGVFGLRCSSETDVEAALTREGLLDLLKPRPRSPQSPLGRSGSIRRTRQSPVAAADRQLHTFLEMTSDPAKFGPSKPISPNWLGLRSPAHSPSHVPSTPSQTSKHFILPLVTHSPSHIASNANLNMDTSNMFVNNNNRPPSPVNSSILHTDNNKNAVVDQETTAHTNTLLNVNVERHTLVQGLRAFDIAPASQDDGGVAQGNESPINQTDLIVTDLEEESENPEPLVLSNPPSRKAPERVGGHSLSSPQTAKKEGDQDTETELNLQAPPNMPVIQVSGESGISVPTEDVSSQSEKEQEGHHDVIDSISSHSQSESPSLNEGSVPTSTGDKESESPLTSSQSSCDSPPSVSTSANSAESHSVGQAPESSTQSFARSSKKASPEKREVKGQSSSKSKPASKTTTASKQPTTRLVRTLTTSENQTMRRVVPITRSGSSATKKPDKSNAEPSNHRLSVHRPSHHGEDSKSPRGREPSQASVVRKTSVRKTTPKPVRPVVPKQPPEEKMCRSTMRALAQAAQAAGVQGAILGEKSASAPQTPVRSPGSATKLPSFARNTVSSTTRVSKRDSVPSVGNSPSASTAGTASTKSSPLARTASFRHPSNRVSPEVPQSSIRRVASIRSSAKKPSGETLAPLRGHERKNSGSFSDKSGYSRDSHTDRPHKPLWR